MNIYKNFDWVVTLMRARHGGRRTVAAAMILGLLAAPVSGFAQNPFIIDGAIPDAGSIQFGDPSGNAKELGPVNGTDTKLGVIHTAIPPMLDFTNPNGSTDIVSIWLQTATDADGDIWLYFAWERDSKNGSSVITYEFQQNELAEECDYSGIDQVLPEDPAETDLINNCNPWEGRAIDDFLIVWDFQGGATDIIIRTFDGAFFDMGIDVTASGDAFAALNGDRSAGEGAINLSETVFPPVPTECFGVGNIVPGTITGNSDQADYKDTVLAPFTDFITISNCGTVIIRKATDPAGADGPFDFTANLDLLPPDAGDPITLPMGGDSITFDNVVAPGSYSVTELDPSATATGFDLTDIDCSASTVPGNVTENVSTRTASFDLGVSETVDCTFTNTGRGNIIVRKVTDPVGDPQSFTFATDYGADFSLSDGQANDSGDLVPGTYSVSETVPAGWDLTLATCDDGSEPGSIGLSAGETVTCTFNNQKDANIIVQKVTDPAGDPQSFAFTASYDADGFSLTDGQSNDSGDLDPDTYSVIETVPAGWDLTSATCDDGSDPGSIGLVAGETVTCTFNNQKDANIIVQKVTDPTGDPQSFAFTASYDADGFSLTDGQSNDSGDLDPDTYSVIETVPAGWDLTSATCDDGSDPGSIGLVAGETVTCTFNNQKDANIIVRKVTEPAGASGSFDFSANYDVDGFTLIDGQSDDSGDLDPGVYSVSETVPAGWNLTSTCDDGSDPGSIDLAAGETVTCTFTNVQRRGAIKITKRRKFASAETGDPLNQPHGGVEFTISGGSLDAPTMVTTDANGEVCLDNLVVSVLVGDYTVAESVPNGYVADGDDSKSVAVIEEATCGSGTETGVAFSNTPLTDVVITVTAQDPGATRSSITCIDESGAEIGVEPLSDPASLTLANQAPKTVVCTILIDP